jgi:predicted NBD/HSP70 family sugar kinase
MYGKSSMKNTEMRIGIDLGGTKIEALAIDNQGVELARHRIDTPRDDYDATIKAMVGWFITWKRRREGQAPWGREFRVASRELPGW